MSTIHFLAWQDRIIDDPVLVALPKEMERRSAARAYLLMPEQLYQNAAVFEPLRAKLGDRLAGVYCSLPQHSPLPDVFAAAREASQCGADLLVSIGGGSNIDAAKLIQYALSVGSFDMDTVLASRTDRVATSPRSAESPIRHVCVPTTLSGAEFTYFAGGRNPNTGLKEAFVVPALLPRTVVFDPSLTTMTPSTLWLSSGLRAMDHAIEGLCAARNHPLGEALALKGIAQLRDGLTATRRDPADLAARRASQFAGWFCSISLMSGVPMGLSHALGHAIGSLFDVPHGLTSCIGLPAVMEFNYAAVPGRFGPIASALGGTAGHQAPDLVRRLIRSLGLPTTLKEVGLGREAFPALISGTLQESWARTNPRKVEADDLLRLLESMLQY